MWDGDAVIRRIGRGRYALKLPAFDETMVGVVMEWLEDHKIGYRFEREVNASKASAAPHPSSFKESSHGYLLELFKDPAWAGKETTYRNITQKLMKMGWKTPNPKKASSSIGRAIKILVGRGELRFERTGKGPGTRIRIWTRDETPPQE